MKLVCCSCLSSALIAAALATTAAAQSAAPAAFVANNGNLEGAVTSFTFDAAGRPQFVQKLVIGARAAGQPEIPGTNAYSIDISPNGRWLMTSHATGADVVEQLTLIEVHADATMSLLHTYLTPDSPLDLTWIDDRHVAVTHTSLSTTNEVIVYAFNDESLEFVEADREPAGVFSTSVTAHPNGRYVYAGDSSGFRIRAFSMDALGELTTIQTLDTEGVYPLGVQVTPDGSRLYAGGGISGTRHHIIGFAIAADGTLSRLANSPFSTTGNSPFDIWFTEDGSIAFVGHGSDATVRSFLVDAADGDLTETGYFFDVGLQGSFGDGGCFGDLVLFTDDFSAVDNTTGLYSYTVQPDGGFITTGPIVGTQATAPTEIAVWNPAPACPEDIDGDGAINLTDLAILLTHFGESASAPGDIDADGDVDLTDLALLLVRFGSDC